MFEKTKIGKNSIPTNAKLGCIPPQAITRQPIELESCSNPLKIGKVLQFAMNEIILDFDVVFY